MASPLPPIISSSFRFLRKPMVAFTIISIVVLAIAFVVLRQQRQPAQPVAEDPEGSAPEFYAVYGFSPNGKRVILVANGSAEVLDPEDGKSLGAIAEDGVLFALFSPEGNRMAVTSGTGLDLWDLTTVPFRKLAQLSKSTNPMLRFSPDGNQLLVLEDLQHAAIFKVATGEAIWRNGDKASAPGGTTAPASASDVLLEEIAFSPEGRDIVVVENHLTGKVDEDPISQLNVLRWSSVTGKPVVAPLALPHSQKFELLNSSGTRVLTSQGTVLFLWDTATGQPVGEPIACQRVAQTMVFSPDDSRLLVETQPGVLQVRATQSGKVLGELRLNGVKEEDVFFANFSQDGKRVLTCSDSGAARTWDAATCAPLCEQISSPKLGPQTFLPDGTRLVGKSENQLQFWDATTLKRAGDPLDVKGLVEDVTFNKDGTKMLTNGNPRLTRPRLWNVATRQEISLKPVAVSLPLR